MTTELREVPVEELTAFMDDFNHHIFDMVSSPDVSEKKGAILAIGTFVYKISFYVHTYLHILHPQRRVPFKQRNEEHDVCIMYNH